jgi:hypothetical protein
MRSEIRADSVRRMILGKLWNCRLLQSSIVVMTVAMFTTTVFGQDMEPRAYSNAPVGLNFLLVAYGRSAGNIVTDESLAIDDVQAKINSSAIGYARTIDFFGDAGKIAVIVPYAWGRATGRISDQLLEIRRSGLSDPRVKLSVNFFGSPALSTREFVKYRSGTVVGASVTVSAPLGQYDPNLRVNLGTNRWAFRPELGFARTQGKWSLETYGSIAFFTDNNRYLNTSKLSQGPIAAVQGHVAYTFKPGLWLAFDAVFFGGGRTEVDGVKRNDLQRNGRYGATFSIPINRQNSVKVLFNDGLYTKIGSRFRSLGVAYQFGWGGK